MAGSKGSLLRLREAVEESLSANNSSSIPDQKLLHVLTEEDFLVERRVLVSKGRSNDETIIKEPFFITFLVDRISVIFRVRSAKAVKITDLDLIKRLGIIVSVFAVFLSIRTMVGPPQVIVARTADDLKAYICQTDWWDHVFTASKCSSSSAIINVTFSYED